MYPAHEKEKVDILLLEDNPGDVRLIVEGFKEGKIPHEIYTVKDGGAAIDFPGRKERYKEAVIPDYRNKRSMRCVENGEKAYKSTSCGR